MNDKLKSNETTTTRATFDANEINHLLRCIQLAITSYARSQKQRPEFAQVAAVFVEELTALDLKVKGLNKT